MNANTDNRGSRVLALLDGQRRVLERLATGAPLEDVLVTLVTIIEEQARDMRCAVLLADAAQKRLRFAAAPRFPCDLKTALEPFMRIGPHMAPCGRAAYLKEPVYAPDAANYPVLATVREIALRNGVRAAWSTPIVSDENRVLGTFAMYYGEPRMPTDEHIRLIDMGVQMARVAIEARQDSDLLRWALDNSPTALIITDIDGRIVRANRAFASQLGYTPAELRAKLLGDITEGMDNAALVRELRGSENAVASDRRYRARDGRLLWARERSSLRHDDSGEARYVVTRVDHLSEADPLAELSERERQVLELVVAGKRSKEIAAQLHISAASVDTYRSRISLKLGIGDVPGLVRFAIRHGIATV